MKYRKLRIAWSVAWGVVAVLLCVLWVRSYWWADDVTMPNVTRVVMLSVQSLPLGIQNWKFTIGDT